MGNCQVLQKIFYFSMPENVFPAVFSQSKKNLEILRFLIHLTIKIKRLKSEMCANRRKFCMNFVVFDACFFIFFVL